MSVSTEPKIWGQRFLPCAAYFLHLRLANISLALVTYFSFLFIGFSFLHSLNKHFLGYPPLFLLCQALCEVMRFYVKHEVAPAPALCPAPRRTWERRSLLRTHHGKHWDRSRHRERDANTSFLIFFTLCSLISCGSDNSRQKSVSFHF